MRWRENLRELRNFWGCADGDAGLFEALCVNAAMATPAAVPAPPAPRAGPGTCTGSQGTPIALALAVSISSLDGWGFESLAALATCNAAALGWVLTSMCSAPSAALVIAM